MTSCCLAMALVVASLPTVAESQDSTATKTTISAFVDLYYAHDFGRPPARDRPFLTQAVRSREFNLNLAHLAVAIERSSVRARLAVQAGTSVQANYAAEPTVGAISGPTLARHIEEASIGAKIGTRWWLDAGIYPSYIGWEGWISTSNPTYTRSLVAEFSPYYLSGVRLTWSPRPEVTVQGHLTNGWQNISENNDDKAVGLRIDVAPSRHLTLVYSNFLGNEQPDGAARRARFFQQVMAKGSVGRLEWQGQLDYGRQGSAQGTRDWVGWVVIGSVGLDSLTRISGRVERYSDPHQLVVSTGTSAGLVANGASIGLDRYFPGGLAWRVEARTIDATAQFFSKDGQAGASKSNLSLVTSLAISF